MNKNTAPCSAGISPSIRPFSKLNWGVQLDIALSGESLFNQFDASVSLLQFTVVDQSGRALSFLLISKRHLHISMRDHQYGGIHQSISDVCYSL